MLERALPSFSASNDWLKAAFHEIGGLVREGESLELHGAAPAWVAALLMHGSTASMSQYLTNYSALSTRFEGFAALRRGLWALRNSSTIERCVERAEPLSGFKATIRSNANRVLTPNAYSRDYLPPNPEAARDASMQIFRLRAQWGSKGNRATALALSTYTTFLTVHPFVDGNGRTFRMLLAADSMGVGRCNPHPALATFLLKSQQSLPFHISAKCARAGDFNMLAHCYHSSLAFTCSTLSPLLRSLDRIPPGEHREQVRWAEEIFALVFEALNQGNSRVGLFTS